MTYRHSNQIVEMRLTGEHHFVAAYSLDESTLPMTSINSASPPVNRFSTALSLSSSTGSLPWSVAGLVTGKQVKKRDLVIKFTHPPSGGSTLKYGSGGITTVNPKQTTGVAP